MNNIVHTAIHELSLLSTQCVHTVGYIIGSKIIYFPSMFINTQNQDCPSKSGMVGEYGSAH